MEQLLAFEEIKDLTYEIIKSYPKGTTVTEIEAILKGRGYRHYRDDLRAAIWSLARKDRIIISPSNILYPGGN